MIDSRWSSITKTSHVLEEKERRRERGEERNMPDSLISNRQMMNDVMPTCIQSKFRNREEHSTLDRTRFSICPIHVLRFPSRITVRTTSLQRRERSEKFSYPSSRMLTTEIVEEANLAIFHAACKKRQSLALKNTDLLGRRPISAHPSIHPSIIDRSRRGWSRLLLCPLCFQERSLSRGR